jgi:poly(hydroxyalkanoate) depolymerase family esterase
MSRRKPRDAIETTRRDLQARLSDYGHQLIPSEPPFRVRGFLSYSHRMDAYHLYIPSAYNGSPLPLVVMLHGCNQSSLDFARGTRMNDIAEELGFFVAYPEQSSFGNLTSTWNWFRADHQMRGTGEPGAIAGIVGDVQRRFAISSNRIFVAGFSSGAALAVIMGVTYPDVFAAVGAHSGLPHGAATNLSSALDAMRWGPPARATVLTNVIPALPRAPTIVFHGDADRTVSDINSHRIISDGRANARLFETIAHHPVGSTSSDIGYTIHTLMTAQGRVCFERWNLHTAGHMWSGGSPLGSYTAPAGPDASREMLRFFFAVAANKSAASPSRRFR